MAITYNTIATTTVTTNPTNTIVFNNIPQTYTDLVCMLWVRGSGGDTFSVRFNDDATTLYSVQRIESYANVAGSRANDANLITADTLTTVTSGNFITYKVDVFSYASTAAKGCLIQASKDLNSTTNGSVALAVGTYRGTSAITNMTLYSSFATQTVASLHGILRA